MNFLLKHNIFSNTDNNKDLSILEIGFLRNSMTPKQKNHLSQKYQVPIRVFEMTTHEIYYYFGYKYITSLDKSNFEGANFFKNLNEMPDENDSKFKQKFDLVIDGGTSEHVYNPIVAFANYFYFLKISGRLVQLLPVNNYIDHGIYQFSPTFFWSIDIAGIRLLNLNFRVNNIKPTDFYWDGNSKYFRSHLDGLWDGSTILNLFRFFSKNIIAVALWEKIAEIDYSKLIIDSHQEVYRKMWKQDTKLTKIEFKLSDIKLLRYIYKNESNVIGKVIGKYYLNSLRSND